MVLHLAAIITSCVSITSCGVTYAHRAKRAVANSQDPTNIVGCYSANNDLWCVTFEWT